MFWDIKETLSYNALLNFVVGNRGCGKSYGSKQWCIEDYLKTGKQFIWVRRFNSEFDDFKNNFYSDIYHNYPEHEFEFKTVNYNTHKFLCDGEVMGYGIPLSVSLKKKSIPYPEVDKIIFDEFIIERGSSYYLKNEVEVFLDLMETVIRLREDFRCVMFIANAITFTNPYFLYFNIKKPNNKKMIKAKDDVLIQFVANEEFIEKKKESRFGKLISGTDYSSYSVDNEFLRDNDDFIGEKQKNLKYFFTLKANNEMYGVWVSNEEGLFYVSNKYDPSYKIVFTTLLENHKPNTMLLKGVSKSILFKSFVDSFKLGLVYFDSIKTKNIVLETIKHTL